MKRILVPTDFSDCANSAAQMALQLAMKNGAELLYLHLAIDEESLPHVPGTPTAVIGHEIGQARYKLDNLVHVAEAHGVHAKSELVIGAGSERIEDYIDPFAVDWLVMGSHGATGIREAIIGSKTQHVIRNIQIPSLVVKNKPTNKLLARIVFASTFKEDASYALRIVSEFSKLMGCSLHLLFINLLSHLIDEKVARLMMMKQIEKYSHTAYTLNIAETNDKEFGIAQFAASIDAELIAVAMESRSLLGRLFSPVLAEQLINHSSLPVLVVNPMQETAIRNIDS